MERSIEIQFSWPFFVSFSLFLFVLVFLFQLHQFFVFKFINSVSRSLSLAMHVFVYFLLLLWTLIQNEISTCFEIHQYMWYSRLFFYYYESSNKETENQRVSERARVYQMCRCCVINICVAPIYGIHWITNSNALR